MPTYNYEGRNADGKFVAGKRLSQSQDTLSSQLLKEGIIPVRITLSQKSSGLMDQFRRLFKGNKVSVDELGLFARQMHTLATTGVPINSSLRQLAQNARTPQMAEALYGIVEDVESGQDMASAMGNYPKIFTPIMISMVNVGQSAGRLDEAFLRLNQYLELEGAALKRVGAALRYPMLISITLISAIVIINVFVVPTFAKVFTQANIELPLVTRYLIHISNFFTQYWIMLAILVTLFIGWLLYYLRTPDGKYNWSKFQLKIPGVGRIIRRIILLRFTQSFSITINSGIPLMQGMTLVAESLNNAYAYKEITDMRDLIEHGQSITQAAAATALFTPLELQMMSVSEETGQLAQMLSEIAAYYRREVDYDLKRLSDIIEPLLIVILSGVVLFLALAVYLPIWSMVKLVHQ